MFRNLDNLCCFDENDLTALRQALQQRKAFLTPGQETAFIEADLAFHTGVARATKNAVLNDLYQAFIQVHRESWGQANEVPGLNRQGQDLHEQIAEAIARRDSELAQDLTRRMLDLSTDRIQKLLEKNGKLTNIFEERIVAPHGILRKKRPASIWTHAKRPRYEIPSVSAH